VSAFEDDHRSELLRILRGAPAMPAGSIARELGIAEPELRGLIEELIDEHRLVRMEDRLVVVEPAAAPYDDDELPAYPPPVDPPP
jgi:hypothetical protein